MSASPTHVTVRYFASLRAARGLASETVATGASTLRGLYLELAARHGFRLAPEAVRFARGGEFASAESPLGDGDTVDLLPPFAGG